MKIRIGQISIILFTLVLTGCFEPPEVSDIPEVSFKRLSYYEVPDGYIPEVGERAVDSLVLTFEIQDGNGDVGLSADENFPPYHSYNRIIDSNGLLVRLGGEYELPFYSIDYFNNFSLYSEVDNRPPYSCKSYVIENGEVGENYDSAIFIEQNPYHYNLNVEIQKKLNGEYQAVNYAEYTGNVDCSLSSFNSRIPIFDADNLGKTMKGEISYSMPTNGHKYVLSRDTFKLRFYIYDRALNQSNIVDTPDLTLPQILVD